MISGIALVGIVSQANISCKLAAKCMYLLAVFLSRRLLPGFKPELFQNCKKINIKISRDVLGARKIGSETFWFDWACFRLAHIFTEFIWISYGFIYPTYKVKAILSNHRPLGDHVLWAGPHLP